MKDDHKTFQSFLSEQERQKEKAKSDKIAIAELILVLGNLETHLAWDILIANNRLSYPDMRPQLSDGYNTPKFIDERFKEFKRLARKRFASHSFDRKFERVHNLLKEILAVRNCLAHSRVSIEPRHAKSILVSIVRPDSAKDGNDWRNSDRWREFRLSDAEITAMTGTVHAITTWINSIHIELTEFAPDPESHWLHLPDFSWPGSFRKRPYPWDWQQPPKGLSSETAKQR